MNDTEYHQLADQTIFQIEELLDELETETDIDYENAGGVLTLVFENKTQVIINKQPPVHEIWVAAKSGGFHLKYKDGAWQSSTEELFSLLSRVCTEQAGETITLSNK
ncbi:iron donor protein CyaY [Candidatus Albibeggiatoa sp. nov. NOAA]|uniref:iron donor protein CyaY n=1 Tax=Candidatus Albibeggiatoa sp. nov. NOAA TaxID=3162724 RepID=UPI0032FC32A9|nr:iron donor protein CyaY [Thiotrichaceae bacterium]